MSETPPAIVGPSPLPGGPERSFTERLIYGISLPERLARSACGLTAGTARELAEFLVPKSFQDSKTYEVVVRNSLDFLTSDIGGVARRETGQPQLEAEDFLARKAVGSFMDFAGMAMLHVSPVWILAIISDVAYGTKSYIHELAVELEAQGLIDDASTIHHVDDVLSAVQRASGSAVTTLDRPPLSLDALKGSLDQTRQALAGADPRKLFPEKEIARLWTGMRDLAKTEKVSLLGASGVLAMQSLSTLKSASQGALASVAVARQIIDRAVLSHYSEALARIHEKGMWVSVRETYRPYVDAVWNNFHSGRRTWTDAAFDSQTWLKAWLGMRRWFRRRKPRPPRETT